MIISNMFNESYLIFWSIAALTAYILYLIFKRFRLFNDYSDDYNYLPSNCYDTRYINEASAFFDSGLYAYSRMSTENYDVQRNEITIEEIDWDITTLELPVGTVPIIEEPTDDYCAENDLEQQWPAEEISIVIEADNNLDQIMLLAIEYNVPMEEINMDFVGDEINDNSFDQIMPFAIECNVPIREISIDFVDDKKNDAIFNQIMPYAIEYNVSIKEISIDFVGDERNDASFDQIMPLAFEYNVPMGETNIDDEINYKNFDQVVADNVTDNSLGDEVFDDVNEHQSPTMKDELELDALASSVSSSKNDKTKKKKRKMFKRFFRGLFCCGCVKVANE